MQTTIFKDMELEAPVSEQDVPSDRTGKVQIANESPEPISK